MFESKQTFRRREFCRNQIELLGAQNSQAFKSKIKENKLLELILIN